MVITFRYWVKLDFHKNECKNEILRYLPSTCQWANGAGFRRNEKCTIYIEWFRMTR